MHTLPLWLRLAFLGSALIAPAGPVLGFDTVFHDGFDFPANHRSPLGSNLDGVTDWSSSYNFVDVMKQSREWITQDTTGGVWDTGEEGCLDLDENGYLRSLAPVAGNPGCGAASYNAVSTLFFFGDLAGHYPGGRYVVTYDGSATISYHFAAQKNLALSQPGRDVVDVDAGQGGWMMRFDAIDAANPPRAVHVWMPGYDEHSGPSQLFHPDFLALVRRNKALRFMDWMNTNDSQQQEFADRPRPDHVRWTSGGGVPLELMVELANRLDADPWFNMPHRASDDYMVQFAQRVHALLQRNRRVYIEYSNEVWNGQFSQADYARAMGIAAWGNVASDFELQLSWYGQRSARMCELWKTAWGSDATRITCVLGAQAANAWTQQQAADCPQWSAGAPCSAHGLDAVAIAPYIGGYIGDPGTQATVASWTLDTLFDEFNVGGQLPGGPGAGALALASGWIDAHHATAVQRNLRLISYEGGQHLVGYGGAENNVALTTLLTNANRDARMGAAYASHLDAWRDHGGELFMHFTASGTYDKWGNWGAVEYLDQTNTPKQQALQQFITANPCWWSGCD